MRETTLKRSWGLLATFSTPSRHLPGTISLPSRGHLESFPERSRASPHTVTLTSPGSLAIDDRSSSRFRLIFTRFFAFSRFRIVTDFLHTSDFLSGFHPRRFSVEDVPHFVRHEYRPVGTRRDCVSEEGHPDRVRGSSMTPSEECTLPFQSPILKPGHPPTPPSRLANSFPRFEYKPRRSPRPPHSGSPESPRTGPAPRDPVRGLFVPGLLWGVRWSPRGFKMRQ
jgi:hypothetical protein